MFRHIILEKKLGYGLTYHYYPKQDVIAIRIPEERLNEYDLENGIVHEITEAFLRKIVKQLENYFTTDEQMEKWEVEGHGFFEEPFHLLATLSGDRYDLVAHYRDFLEARFEEEAKSKSSHPRDRFFKSQ